MESFFTKDVIDQLLNYPLVIIILVVIWMNNKNVTRFIEAIEKFISELKK